MNYKKDMVGGEEESKGQENSLLGLNQNKSIISYENLSIVLNKRTEKLVTALYMVTDCMDHNEPLRHQLRLLGVELLSDMQSLALAAVHEKNIIFDDIKQKISEISSLVEIARAVSMVSDMNGGILLKEFVSLKATIEKKHYENKIGHNQESLFGNSSGTNIIFPEHFFSNTDQPHTQNDTMDRLLEFKGQQKDTQKQESNNVPNESVKKEVSAQAQPKSDIALRLMRRNNIIKFVREKKEVTIKEISKIISDCSEKTIQRELMALVSEGVLKKEGDKRWSKYSLGNK